MVTIVCHVLEIQLTTLCVVPEVYAMTVEMEQASVFVLTMS